MLCFSLDEVFFEDVVAQMRLALHQLGHRQILLIPSLSLFLFGEEDLHLVSLLFLSGA